MEELVKYLVEEKKQTQNVAQLLIKKFEKHDDIKEACIKWIKTREFSESVIVNGYTDKTLHELNPDLDGFGIYKIMITIRENPLKFEEYLNNNFSKK